MARFTIFHASNGRPTHIRDNHTGISITGRPGRLVQVSRDIENRHDYRSFFRLALLDLDSGRLMRDPRPGEREMLKRLSSEE